ncbi:hypothetical protein GEMRC1_013270 [Eukaryota sp. GEM-RC1]
MGCSSSVPVQEPDNDQVPIVDKQDDISAQDNVIQDNENQDNENQEHDNEDSPSSIVRPDSLSSDSASPCPPSPSPQSPEPIPAEDVLVDPSSDVNKVAEESPILSPDSSPTPSEKPSPKPSTIPSSIKKPHTSSPISPRYRPNFVSESLGSYEVQEIRQHEEKNLLKQADRYSRKREEFEAEEMKILEYESMIKRQAEKERKAREEQERVQRKDLEDAQNPDLLSFFVVFPASVIPSNEESITDDVTDSRVVYRYHLPKDAGTVLDLKLAVNLDFGFSFSQQRFFYNGSLLEDNLLLTSLPNFEDGSYISFFPLGEAIVKDVTCLKPKHVEENIQDIVNDQLVKRNDVDDVICRQWINELIDIRSMPADNLEQSLAREKRLVLLRAEFEYAAQKAVAMVLSNELNERKVKLSAVYGNHGGDTFVIGGIVIRKAQNWEVLQEDIGEGDLAFKVAALEAANSALLHSLIDPLSDTHPLSRLFPSLAICIDAFGHRFLCESVLPVTPSMLVYGSYDSGVTVKREQCVEKVVGELAEKLNLKKHKVYAKVDPETPIPFELSLNSEIYMGLEGELFYIRSVSQMFPPDAPRKNTIDHVTKLFPAEFCLNYSKKDELMTGYKAFNSLEPIMCDHCSTVIEEYSYKSHKSRNYDICNTCYHDEDETKLRFGKSKLMSKIVPKEHRVLYWKNLETGDVTFEEPIERTPLNPNAYILKHHPMGLVDDTDVNELKEASNKLLTRTIPTFLDDLNEEKVEIITSEQLIDEMKKVGISIDHLGDLFDGLTLRHHKEMVLVEMLSEALVVLIRDGLSYIEEKNQDDLKTTVVYYLNQALTLLENENSDHLWSFVEGLVLKKFDFELDEKVVNKIQLNSLLFSVAKKLGLVLDLTLMERIDYGDEEPINVDDILGVVPVTSIDVSNYTSHEVNKILVEARDEDSKGMPSEWWLTGGLERQRASELFDSAVVVAKSLYLDEETEEPISSFCAVALADVLIEVAGHYESRHQESGRPEHSRWNRSAGIPESELSEKARGLYSEVVSLIDMAVGQSHQSQFNSIFASDRRVFITKSKAVVALARLSKSNQHDVYNDLDVNLMFIERVCGRLSPYTAKLMLDLAFSIHEANVDNEIDLTEASARHARRSYLSLVKVYGDGEDLMTADTRFLTSDSACNVYVEVAYRAVRQFETILASPLASVSREMLPEKIENFEVSGEIDDEYEDDF